MKLFKGLSLILFLFLAANVPAQKFLSKPYTEWKKSDALKIVNDSAWSKTYQSTEAAAGADMQAVQRAQGQTANRGGGNPGSVERNGGRLPLVARLHSSPYVRQALIRLRQLDADYDKMNAEDKAKFDASTKGFLDCDICNDYYVVTFTKYTDASGESVNEGIFESLKLDDLKGNVYLVNDKDEKREIYQFTPAKGGGDSSIFFFKRLDDQGKPLLTPDTKNFELRFSGEFMDWDKRYKGLYPKKFEFSVSKMIVDGKVMF